MVFLLVKELFKCSFYSEVSLGGGRRGKEINRKDLKLLAKWTIIVTTAIQILTTEFSSLKVIVSVPQYTAHLRRTATKYIRPQVRGINTNIILQLLSKDLSGLLIDKYMK